VITESDKKYVESLFPALAEIQDPNLREKVIGIWAEAWKDGNYEKIEDIGWWEPWRNKYTWSNVSHTNQVTKCVMAMAKVTQEVMGMEVNMDYLIAAAILHDVDKAVLFDGKTKEPTEWLRKLPHASYSVYLVLKAGLPLDIAHMVLSHTAFSLKRQKTVEALILHMADYLIADLRNFKEGVDFLWSAEVPRYTELPDVK